MSNELWVLGATGRTGRAIATHLADRGAPLVLVGRDAERLAAAADPIQARTVVAETPTDMIAALRADKPALVVNTVGPFQDTAVDMAEAVLPTGDYVDLANDVGTLAELLNRDDLARKHGHTLVTGAGFGVTATESVLTWLMIGQPPAESVRIDMIPSIASTTGVLGEAFARTIVEGLPGVPGGGRFSGRRIAAGKLARAPLGGAPLRLSTPDGDEVTTALMPLGELLSAQHATRARFISSGSSEAPSGKLARLAMPAVLPLLQIGAVRRFAARRLAAIKTTDRPRPREHSWAHAHIEWPDHTAREGWLQLPDAGDFTASVAAEVAFRLFGGQGTPGAFTPAALFGTALAEACGGQYLSDTGPAGI